MTEIISPPTSFRPIFVIYAEKLLSIVKSNCRKQFTPILWKHNIDVVYP